MLTDREHVLHNSDTYIGSIEQVQEDQYVLEPANEDESGRERIVKKSINYIPGLYKLFDEAIVNCRDHVIRCQQKITSGDENTKPVKQIVVVFNNNGSISVENDGNGIDVVEHPEHKLWVPEMIFGHLRTGTNYNKEEKKIVGGKNGFGVKLIFIWSTYGKVETFDHIRGLKYTQEFKNNLTEIDKPKITKQKTGKPYTRITFLPDYKRMGIDGLSCEFKQLLMRRVYDIAAITDKSVKVSVNANPLIKTNSIIPVRDFQSYVSCYLGDKQITKRLYESPNERWEYVVAMSKSDCFEHVSFVNGIATYKGGRHVDYIANQLVRKISEYIAKKKKVTVKTSVIKEQLHLFLRCDIENPAFSSQSKDFLDTPISKFGSSCFVSDDFAEKVAKLGVMDVACKLTEIKEKTASHKTDGTKTSTITGIPKLCDANWAGTRKSGQCLLILCEGDSAKAGIMSALSTKDRDTIGIYPLRGKLKNIRGEKTKDINDNKEISEIKKILGLKANMSFKTTEDIEKQLRYGKVIFMTDQDLDGTHIKGLCINMFDVAWNDLLRHKVIGFMNTPILKAIKGKEENVFYNDGEYERWKATKSPGELTKYTVNYYKGLGTSTKKEFQEYFKNKRIILFTHSGDECVNALDMVFNKKKADERKEWLGNYNRHQFLDTSKTEIDYREFIHYEMKHFSKYDCERNIPNLMDGLKTNQRKILYSCFCKNLNPKTKIKVAQLSGYVSEKSCYHHGEQSLNDSIVSMAQTFVGSNNINMLMPEGQFGSRMGGGSDAASPRYIFTTLNALTRKIFIQADEPVLEYLNDDGTIVEPIFYVPIIPMILVNGTNGIGTGFSTTVLPHNPVDIINTLQTVIGETFGDNALKAHCGKEDVDVMMPLITNALDAKFEYYESTNNDVLPYFSGFKGSVSWLNDDHSRVLIKGCYEVKSDNELLITELPIGLWTEKYKCFLEDLIETQKKEGSIAIGNARKSKSNSKSSSLNTTPTKKKTTKKEQDTNTITIKDYHDMSTDNEINITIRLSHGSFHDLMAQHGKHQEQTNMLEQTFKLATTMHTTNMHLFDYNENLRKYKSYYDIIHNYMPTRFKYYILRKNHQQGDLEKQMKTISNKTRYIKMILEDVIDLRRKKKDAIEEMLRHHQFDQQHDGTKDSFNYLVKMPMDSVSYENIEKLNNEYASIKEQLETITKTSIFELWLNELASLKDALCASCTSIPPKTEKSTEQSTKCSVETAAPKKKRVVLKKKH